MYFYQKYFFISMKIHFFFFLWEALFLSKTYYDFENKSRLKNLKIMNDNYYATISTKELANTHLLWLWKQV
jgi:hypothetical protein